MDWLQVIGWLGSALLVASLLQTRLMRLRVLNLIACLILIGFNAALAVWPMVGMNIVLSAINIYFIVKLLRQRHDSRVYRAVPIGVTEPLLTDVLTRHATDIAAFNPGLPADVTAGVEHAFLVSAGDEIVGVVLTREGETPEEQQVVVDYVLPAYRDFTPGEFVFRGDGPFAALGTRRVVANAGMAASEKYLAAVGFQERDGRKVLEFA